MQIFTPHTYRLNNKKQKHQVADCLPHNLADSRFTAISPPPSRTPLPVERPAKKKHRRPAPSASAAPSSGAILPRGLSSRHDHCRDAQDRGARPTMAALGVCVGEPPVEIGRADGGAQKACRGAWPLHVHVRDPRIASPPRTQAGWPGCRPLRLQFAPSSSIARPPATRSYRCRRSAWPTSAPA